MGLFKWRGVFGVGDELKSLPNGAGSGRVEAMNLCWEGM